MHQLNWEDGVELLTLEYVEKQNKDWQDFCLLYELECADLIDLNDEKFKSALGWGIHKDGDQTELDK
jgi:hypothetical protein